MTDLTRKPPFVAAPARSIRRIGAPKEFADVAYLAGASSTIGQVRMLDGGWLL